MKKWIFLSHEYKTSTPGFGGVQGFFREEKSSIAKGRNSNSEQWTIFNHHGTHIDCPFHFDDNGKKVTDYNPSDWVFTSPYLLEVKADDNEILDLLSERNNIPLNSDILIIKTNFEKFRYWKCNPGLAPELGTWLINNRPNIKVIGFDFISLTSFSNREIGKKAHIAFLFAGLRIIEDMKLSTLDFSPASIIVSPLLVQNADGAPVTILAEIS